MRVLLIALALALSACATEPRQMQVPGDSAHPVLGDPNSMWRLHAAASTADRTAAHACLVARNGGCDDLIQKSCNGSYDEDLQSPALARQCDWRAMVVWEDEALASLADLRGKFGGEGLKQLNDDETAWERSMLDDVGIGMDMYEGGSLAGPVGAHIRARAVAQRAAYLYEIQQMTEGE